MRRRKKAHYTKIVVAFSLFLCISLMGVGYAYWTDDVSIGARVTTGHMKTSLNVENSDFKGDYFASFSYSFSQDSTQDDLEQEWYFNIVNEGSVPIRIAYLTKNIEISNLDNNDLNSISNNFMPGDTIYSRIRLSSDSISQGVTAYDSMQLETMNGGWSETYNFSTSLVATVIFTAPEVESELTLPYKETNNSDVNLPVIEPILNQSSATGDDTIQYRPH